MTCQACGDPSDALFCSKAICQFEAAGYNKAKAYVQSVLVAATSSTVGGSMTGGHMVHEPPVDGLRRVYGMISGWLNGE